MKWSIMQDKEGDLPSVSFWGKTIFALIKTLKRIIGSEAKTDFRKEEVRLEAGDSRGIRTSMEGKVIARLTICGSTAAIHGHD